MIKFLKKIILYNNIIKLKTHLLSHFSVAMFYFCEICIFIVTIYEFISVQIDLKNGIIPDYVCGFNTYFFLNQLIGFMLLGIIEIILYILFFIIKLVFKKNFLIKSNFLTKNFIYHIIWLFGFYMNIIILICMTTYLVSILYEGTIWTIDQWHH